MAPTMRHRVYSLGVILSVFALGLVGCSSSSDSLPTAPSGTTSAPATGSTDAAADTTPSVKVGNQEASGAGPEMER